MKGFVLFSLLVVGGESVLLPALRLEMGSRHGAVIVMAIAVAATVLSDLFWYWVGRCGARSPLLANRAFIERARRRRWVSAEHFEAHWKKLLLLSKFVYGTRTPAQLICGATNRRLTHYLGINTLGTALLIVYLDGLIVLFANGFSFMNRWPNVVSTVAATALLSFLVGRGAWLVLRHRSGI